MNRWSDPILASELAQEIRAAFESALADGLSVSAATEQVLEDFAPALDDPATEPAVYLTLAALQLEHDALQPQIRLKALGIINSGQQPAGPDGRPGPGDYEQAVEQLKARLLGTAGPASR